VNSIFRKLIYSGIESEAVTLSHQLSGLMDRLQYLEGKKLVESADTAEILALAGALEQFAKVINFVKKEV
jgi:hypothetical protein